MIPYVYSSVTRISDLPTVAFAVEPLAERFWETGDYVVGEVEGGGGEDLTVELPNGRMIEAASSDLVVGSFGRRQATLDATGDWERIGPDGRMHALTEGGLFGKCVSRSQFIRPLMSLTYRGHALRNGAKLRMPDFVAAVEETPFMTPVVLLIGSSMSAGKTTTARVVIRLLKAAGCRIVAAKLTGAGRYHDVLTMKDAGADAVFDFVDAGMPSTVCPVESYRRALRPLLSRIGAVMADVAVVEVGASPLEPYNGATAVKEIGANVRATILCASDPYAVIGVMSAFEARPDLVTGIAANTEAGIALVEALSGVPALNLNEPTASIRLMTILREKFWGGAPPDVPAWFLWTGL